MKKIILFILILALILSFASCAPNTEDTKIDPQNPTKIEVWTYYNGSQQLAFDTLVEKFNQTEGSKGMFIEHFTLGGITELTDEIIKAAKGSVGAKEPPNLVMVYPETAYLLNDMKKLVDLGTSFTKEELSKYVPNFIEEGRFEEGGSLFICPVAKSTEVMILNKTDWNKFSAATGTDLEKLQTVEGVTEVAKQYFEWTDSLTPAIKDDGKAFYGRDAMDNYMIVGAAQLGKRISTINENKVSINLDKDAMRTLWEQYYIPYINGYYASSGKFRSDDAKTGQIISYVGSSTSAGYFPDKVTLSDDSSYAVDALVLSAPYFKDATVRYSVQQGAGFSMIGKSAKENYVAAEFLKWITAEEQNVEFAVTSSYLPVLISSNDEEKIEKAFGDETGIEKESMIMGMKTINSGNFYVDKPYPGSSDVRAVLRDSLQTVAGTARTYILTKTGEDRKKAIDQLSAESEFENWFKNLNTSLETIVK